MEIIYADLLFLQDMAADYLLCLAAARICGVVLRRARYLAAAVLGGAYSVCSILPGLEFLRLWPVKLCLWLFMALIAFGGERRFFRCALSFLAVSALFGGAIYALNLTSGSPKSSFLVFAVSFTLCYAVISLFFSGKAKMRDKERLKLTISLNGRESELMAMLDTGNSLTDPLSGEKLLILSPQALSPLLGETSKLFELDAVSALEALSGIESLRGRLRLVPYSAVGGRGMLCAVRLDSAVIGEKELKSPLAAVSKDVHGDGFEAIY